MSRLMPLPGLLPALLALVLAAVPANAQQARSFVSGLGNDANAPNCTRTAPCRTFQTAHDNTLANGEITVLDPGSYGSVTINRNISIINDGVGETGILVSGGGTAITVNAMGAAVTLRGLTIKGIGFGGGNGINFMTGAALNVENGTIRNLDGMNVGNAILFMPGTTAVLQVTNTIITDNGANAILIAPTGVAGAVAVVDHVGLYNNGFAGINANGLGSTGGRIAVVATDTVASNNGPPGNGAGFLAQTTGGFAVVHLTMVRCVAIANAGFGVWTIGTGANIYVNQSTITENGNGWVAGGGPIFTYGNNAVFNNTANEGAQTPITAK